MTFTKISNLNYKLSRFASTNKFLIVGGFSKLLEYFKNHYKWEKIITYADLRWSDMDNIYSTTFNSYKLLKPEYFYTMNTTRLHKFLFRKKNIKLKFPDLYDSNLTESEMMKKTGYKKIYDAGKIKYILIKQ